MSAGEYQAALIAGIEDRVREEVARETARLREVVQRLAEARSAAVAEALDWEIRCLELEAEVKALRRRRLDLEAEVEALRRRLEEGR